MDIWIAETLGNGQIAVRTFMSEESSACTIAAVHPEDIIFFSELSPVEV